MNCQDTMSFLNNEELFTIALDNSQDLPDKARFHLEQCKLCQNSLTTYKQMNQTLLSALYRKQCPTSIALSAYSAYALPRDEQVHIQLHLRICPLCAGEVDEVRHFLADIKELV
ncbi:MAG: hypothetical protein NVSMB38_29220 [Ktedonobacteraceae bacterium]